MNYHGFTEALARHYREQVYAWIKSERNHPSIFCWSIENGMTYINAMNAGWSDRWEPVTALVANDVLAGIDPTRLIHDFCHQPATACHRGDAPAARLGKDESEG